MFGPRIYLGFWLQDHALDAALVMPGRRGLKTLGQVSAAGMGLLTAEDRTQHLRHAFVRCLKGLPRAARRADTPAVLALPDVHVEEEILAFADVPNSQSEATALMSHRMARETGDLPGDLAVSWERLGQDDKGETICRVRAMNAFLRNDIEIAAARAGLRLTRIDGWSGYASGAPSLQSHQAGAAVWSNGTDWSLICWSNADPAGFCQSGRVGDAGSAADIVRLSISYARSLGIDAGPLSADVPDDFAHDLAAAAGKAGLDTRVMTQGARAQQVAGWA